MKASNNINDDGRSTLSILDDQNPNPANFTCLKEILPADVSSCCFSSYELDVDQIIIRRRQQPNKSSPLPVVDDSELSIFDARNYFNDPIVHDKQQQQQQQQQIINNVTPHYHHHHNYNPVVVSPESSRLSSSSLQGRSGVLRWSYATPTSEASCNSHTGLLTNPPAAAAAAALNISESSLISSSSSRRLELDPTARKKKGAAGPAAAAARWFLLGCKTCRPCSGKKSAQVKITKPLTATAPTSRLKDQVLIHPPPLAASISNSMQQQLEEEEEEDSDRTVANSNYTCSSRISLGVGGGGGGFTFPDLLNPPTKNSSPMMKKVLLMNTRATATAAAAIHHLPYDDDDDDDDDMMMAAEPAPFAMQEDPPRYSLEVFQSSTSSSGAAGDGRISGRKSVVIKASSRDDGHLVLAAAAATASPPRPRPTLRPRPDDDIDDMGSDASSDLFEIESFSTTTDHYSSSYPPIITTSSRYAAAAATGQHRDSLDEARPRFSTAVNNNNYSNYYDDHEYEPSEASVAWTVTTAAYDQASMAGCSVSASDVEEFTRLQLRLHHHLLSANHKNHNHNNEKRIRQIITSDPSATGTSGGGGGGGLLMMSCRCEKAVSVGPNPVKFHPPPSSPSRHVTVSGSRAEGGRSTTSHAARLSLAFAT